MTELVDMQGGIVRKGRVSPALLTAIKLIVEQGLTQADAAARIGMKGPSLSIALKKPHVRAVVASVKRAWLDNKTGKAWLTVADLAENAGSEDVRLKAARVFIEADEAARNAMPEQARQLVQIIAQNVNMGTQPPTERSSGVIEAVPYQVLSPKPSNSQPVGRAESDGDEGADDGL